MGDDDPGFTFEQLRNAPERKPSAKRSQHDAANLRDAFREEKEATYREGSDRTTEDELTRDGVDFGIEMDRKRGR